jgi:hypothetical protein
MKRIIIAFAIVFLFVSIAMAAGPKTYQVTGPVLDKDTKVKGDLKVGSKVTIEYTMTAASVDVKEEKKAAEKKPAAAAPAKK